MAKIKLKVDFPILKSYQSDKYALIIIDSSGVTHYWDGDGAYDGWSMPGCCDPQTKQNLN